MFWQAINNPIGLASEEIHKKLETLLPKENYVRLQPTLDKVYAFDCHSYEENMELCQVACDFLRDNQALIEQALKILI